VCAAKILVKRPLQRTAKVITTRNYFKRECITRAAHSNGLVRVLLFGGSLLERGTWLSAPHPIIIIILIIQRAETISSCSQITYTHTQVVSSHTLILEAERTSKSPDDAYAPGSFARTASSIPNFNPRSQPASAQCKPLKRHCRAVFPSADCISLFASVFVHFCVLPRAKSLPSAISAAANSDPLRKLIMLIF
jgi:hypothetical protein